MSGMDAALLFDEALSARASRAAALRLVVLRAETVRVPRRLRSLRVLTGSAWISLNGRDMIVTEGQAVELPFARESALGRGFTPRAPLAHAIIHTLRRMFEGRSPAVVSAVGCPAVVFEMR